MKNSSRTILYIMLSIFMFASPVYAADEPFIDRFLGSPLLILVGVIIIDVIAFAYHKIRK
jgi:hypothetical protein